MSANWYRAIADRARGIPAKFGLREHSVVLRRTSATLAGTVLGETSAQAVTEYPIVTGDGSNVKVRWLNQREIALGGLALGTVEIGPFTPLNPAGGFDRLLLGDSGLSTGSSVLVRITGPTHPDGADYRIQRTATDRALRIILTCVPAESA